ncbi:hypothetical protein BGW39_007513 [Mortierella sp. 14UC]|nr:hypothetical protein BGW39_007513 [Mortierella sp. 14UC]
MPRLSLPVVTQLPNITIIDARTPEARLNLRRRRYIIRVRTFTHNILYVLTFLSWGLTMVYQALLEVPQLKARNWIGFFLPVLVPLSDPRITCLHEASAPILFLAWSVLCAEWFAALMDISDVRGLRYASRVGCVQGSSACNVLLGYIVAVFGVVLCFFIELVAILAVHHGQQIREAFSACWACRAVVARFKRDTPTPPATAPAAPVELEEFDADNQSTVYTIITPSASGAQTPIVPNPYELNIDNLRWLEMLYATDSDDEAIPYNVYGQDDGLSAPSIAAATIASAPRRPAEADSSLEEELHVQEETQLQGASHVQEESHQEQEHFSHTIPFTPNVCVVSIPDEIASPPLLIHRPLIPVLPLLKQDLKGVASLLEGTYPHHTSVVAQSAPAAASPINTCYLLNFGPKATARFREEMGFGSYEVDHYAPVGLFVAAVRGKQAVGTAAAAEQFDGNVAVEEGEDAATAVTAGQFDGNATVEKAEGIGAVAAEGVDGATANPEGGAFGANIYGQNHGNVYTYFEHRHQLWWESYRKVIRNHMCWLARWDDRLERNVHWELLRPAFENPGSRSSSSTRSSSAP